MLSMVALKTSTFTGERRQRAAGTCPLAESHATTKVRAPSFSAGVNPLFDAQRSMSPDGGEKSVGGKPSAKIAKKAPSGGGAGAGAGAAAKPRQRSGEGGAAAAARRKRTASPQSTLTTSTTQSDSSRRPAATTATAKQPSGRAAVQQAPSKQQQQQQAQPKGSARSAPASRNGSINKGGSGGGRKEEFVPAPLVPALLAPVPPPPRKRKTIADVETGEVGEVLEDAPDKTIMEMLQTYLKKQDLYTRIVLVVVLLVLAGGVMGAYVVMLLYAIREQNPKYIVLVTVFSLILFWVLWKVRKMQGKEEEME